MARGLRCARHAHLKQNGLLPSLCSWSLATSFVSHPGRVRERLETGTQKGNNYCITFLKIFYHIQMLQLNRIGVNRGRRDARVLLGLGRFQNQGCSQGKRICIYLCASQRAIWNKWLSKGKGRWIIVYQFLLVYSIQNDHIHRRERESVHDTTGFLFFFSFLYFSINFSCSSYLQIIRCSYATHSHHTHVKLHWSRWRTH